MTKLSLRLAAPVVALAATLTFAGAAQADLPKAPPAAQAEAPLSDAELLGRHIVGQALAHVDDIKPYTTMLMAVAQAKMKAEAEKRGGTYLMAYERFSPWMQFFTDACFDEFDNDRPKFERIVGGWLAKKYTVEQLQAVSDLLDSPAGSEFYTQLMAQAPNMMAKKSTPDFKWSPAAQAAINRFEASHGGKGFLERSKGMKDLDKDPDTLNMLMDVVAAYMPGLAKSWGEKAEAAEDARQAALAGTPPPPPATSH
ncbi:MAG TPA: hypothetical protein VG407_02130 [Caulobacteraceae bacterium]|jgi:hypothetical protein|nr:hypothetical protein [Caulobacteraceae bacterium]